VELLAALEITVALLGSAQALPPDPAESLARRLDERQRTVGDLTARFVQTYRSGIMGREVVERGVVSIKRPGRMLWEYHDPEKKTFLADGQKFYFYVPADRQVVIQEQAGERSIPALLLSGRSRILSEFHVAAESAPAGLSRLRLTPRQADPEIAKVVLDVDAKDRIRAIQVLDTQGNQSRFQFDDIRENVGLPDRLFRFQIPRGVEVVRG